MEPAISNIDDGPFVAKIYDAALKLFSEKGYRGTSMRDLGDALGHQPGSFYTHIRGKEDILFGIINRFQEIHQRDMERVMVASLSPVEKLRTLIECHINLIVDNPQTATVYFHEWNQLGDDNREIVVTNRNRFEDGLKAVIVDCISDNSFDELDVSLAAKAALGMLNWTFEWFDPHGRLTGDEIAALFADYLIEGFRSR